jgi:multiple sugar transport system permease protein
VSLGAPSLASKIAGALRYVILVFWAVVCLIPLYWVLVNSFKTVLDVAQGPRYLPFVDFTPQLDAWRYIFFEPGERLVSQFFNSVIVATSATVLAMLTGAMATYALTRFRFHWSSSNTNNLIWFMLLASRILPPVAVLVPVYSIAERHGMLDTHWLLVMLYTAANLPVVMWLMRPVFGEKAWEQEEAAWLEGSTHFELFFGILLPMLTRSLIAIAFLIFLLSWNEYLLAQYLAGNHAMTLPPWLVSQISYREAQIIAEEDEITHLSAAIVLMVAPLLLLVGGVQSALKRSLADLSGR